MLAPVSNGGFVSAHEVPLVDPAPSTDPNSSSTLVSLQEEDTPSGFLDYLTSLGKGVFVAVWTFSCSFFSYLRSWIFPPHEEAQETPLSYTIELPHTPALVKDDPFETLVFIQQEGGTRAFRNQVVYSLMHKLFIHYLGHHGAAGWGAHYSAIKTIQEEVETLPQHPFEILTYLFLTKEFSSAVVNFYEVAHGYGIGAVCRLKREGNPWQQFMNKQAENCNRHAATLPGMIPRFAQMLCLEEETLAQYVREEDWIGLIDHIFQARRSFFSL